MSLQYIEWTNLFPDDEVKGKMPLFPLRRRRNPQERTQLAGLHYLSSRVSILYRNSSPGLGSNTRVMFWPCPVLPPGFREALNMDTAPRSQAWDSEEARLRLTAPLFNHNLVCGCQVLGWSAGQTERGCLVESTIDPWENKAWLGKLLGRQMI